MWYHIRKKDGENVDFGADKMYEKKSDRLQLAMEDFMLPFGGHLSGENRWVKLAQLMPWEMVEEICAGNFKNKKPTGDLRFRKGLPLEPCTHTGIRAFYRRENRGKHR